MLGLWLPIVSILVLLIVGGFISAYRYSLQYVRKSDLENRVKSGCPRAELALKLNDKQDRIQLNVEIILIILTVVAVTIAIAFLCDDLSLLITDIAPNLPPQCCHWSALALLILIISFLRMLICENIPRSIALKAPFNLALIAAGPINFILRIMSVPTAFLNLISDLIVRLIYRKQPESTDGAAEEKIIDMIDEGIKTGEFDIAEQELLKSVFEFGDTTASQVMTPRTDVSAVDINDPPEKSLRYIREEGFSRYPVYENDIDHIIGIIYTRDIINILYDNKLFILQDLVRPAYFIPDSKKISDLLKEFQTRQNHLAVVLDEFGGTAGIISIEDILEEIVGEIQDEYDVEEEEFVLLDPDTAEVLSSMDVDDFNELFEADLPEDQADTIGGLIFTTLGELPGQRQKIVIDSVEFTILLVEGTRIQKVLAKKTTPPPKTEEPH